MGPRLHGTYTGTHRYYRIFTMLSRLGVDRLTYAPQNTAVSSRDDATDGTHALTPPPGLHVGRRHTYGAKTYRLSVWRAPSADTDSTSRFPHVPRALGVRIGGVTGVSALRGRG